MRSSRNGPYSMVVLESRNLALDDIDLFEINDAFAGQYLAAERTWASNQRGPVVAAACLAPRFIKNARVSYWP